MPAFYRMYYRDDYRLNNRANYRHLLFALSSPPFPFSSTLSPSLPLCIIFTSYFYVPPPSPPLLLPIQSTFWPFLSLNNESLYHGIIGTPLLLAYLIY